MSARNLRLRQLRPTGGRDMDETVMKIAGEKRLPWRVVDDEGVVLNLRVQTRRDRRAALPELDLTARL